MKKLLSLLLALTMICACAMAEVDVIPANVEEMTYEGEGTYDAVFYGLWENNIDVNGVNRKAYFYTPESYYACTEMLQVFVPNGIAAPDFAEQSGWLELSEEHGFCIVFYEGQDLTWNFDDVQSELDYYIAVQTAIGNRVISDTSEGALYAIGYGEGGTMAQYAALNYSAMLAGVVTLGGSAIPAEYLEEVGNKESYAFAINQDWTNTYGTLNKDVVLPIWIINDGDANEALIDYWKTANQVVEGDGLKNSYADEIYNQNPLSTLETLNSRNISRVWISEIEGAASCFDRDFEEFVWTQFLTKVHRYTSERNGALRAGYSADDIGLVRYDVVDSEHDDRFFYAYVPTWYDGESELPLVLVFPGHSISALLGAQQTEWWRVAENRGIAVAFCHGSRCSGTPLAGCVAWDTAADFEIEYVNAVIDKMSSEYKIDSSRMYITGHSNGGMMTSALALNPEMRTKFAAAANVGGAFVSGDVEPDGTIIPYLTMVGQFDLAGMGNYPAEDCLSTAHINMHLAANGMADAVASIKDTGGSTTYTFDKDGVRMTEMVVTKNFHHSYTLSMAYYVWDEFFSNYARTEDGGITYRGAAVE